jgi:multiple sugar transport system permease protein
VRKSALVGWLLLAPSLLLLGGLVVFPVLYNVWLSLFDKHAFMPVQAFVGLGHYRYFATDPEFWTSFY